MPVTMGGVASGMDTDAIIDKLVKIEAQPIVKFERDIQKSNQRKEALKQLGLHLKNINKSARDLYGFRASFDDKKAVSSDPTVLDAVATKKAIKGLKKIEVMKVASNHKIATDHLKNMDKLPSGKFSLEVDGEKVTINFKGGRLKRLKERIDEEASEFVETELINTDSDRYVLTIQSKKSGKKGEIKIKGDAKFLRKLGLVNGHKSGDKSSVGFTFDRRYFQAYNGSEQVGTQSGSLDISKDGKAVTLNGLLWQDYTLPVDPMIKNETVFEFQFEYKDRPKEEDTTPRRLEFGPQEKINIKGIELFGYNVSRLRKAKEKKLPKYDSVLGVGIVAFDNNNKRIEKIYPVEKDSKGKQVIPVGKAFAGKKVSKVVFYCNDGSSRFFSAAFLTPEKDKDFLQPKNEIAKAEDAKLKIDGVEIKRDKNDGLTDVIQGVTLNLKKRSEIPVDLKIEPDIEKSMNKIRKFVEAYNKYLSLNKELTKTEKITKPDGGKRRRKEKGLFVGDMSIVRLESTLRRTVNDAYPTRAAEPIKIFPQVGVSTGKIRAEWETIKEGRLVIDEEQVSKAIRENPEGVRMFFGSDTDGDNKVDNGMAYTVVNQLKPYVQFGKNIISTKIDLEDEAIKMSNDRIARQEDHIKKYEAKLRQKFGSMERAMQGANAQRNWMNNQFNGGEKKK